MAVSAAPETIPSLVLRQAAQHGAATILRRKNRGLWRSMSWSELADQMRRVAAGLAAHGFARGDVAGILSEPRLEWAVVDLGVLAAGGVSAGIPMDCSGAHLCDVLVQTGCSVLFVENEEQLDKVLAVRGDCPALRRIVIFDMKGLREFADSTCESFASMLATAQPDTMAADRAAIDSGHDTAVLLVPEEALKGAIRALTHDDLLREVAMAGSLLGSQPGRERMALLPMSDPVERSYGLYHALTTGTITNYPEGPDTILENMQELQPNIVGATAELWRGLKDHVDRATAAATAVQRMLYVWGIKAGRRGGLGAALARLLIARPLRRELGLARLQVAFVTAPVSAGVATWAASLGVDIRCFDADQSGATQADRRMGVVAMAG